MLRGSLTSHKKSKKSTFFSTCLTVALVTNECTYVFFQPSDDDERYSSFTLSNVCQNVSRYEERENPLP